jgi:hypothetical protein
LEAQLEHEGATRSKAQAEVIKMMNRYGVSYRQAGMDLGKAFAQGMIESEKAVEKAVLALARTVAKYLKTHSPTEEGPLSDLDTWWKGFAPALIAGLDTKAIVDAVDGLASDLKATAGKWAEAGMMLGNNFQQGVLDSLSSLGTMLQSTLTAALNKAWQDAWNAFVPASNALAGQVSAGLGSLPAGVSAGNVVPGSHPAAASGGNTYNIHFPNYVGDKRDLVDTVRTGLIRIGTRNGGGAIGGVG